MRNGKAKSATALATEHQREAYIEERCKPVPIMAPFFIRQADELLALPGAPDVGPGGEVVRTHSVPDKFVTALCSDNTIARLNIRDTLAQGATRIAEDASIRRADLLMQPSFDCVALGIDTAESIDAANGIEKMLAHQMAVAHEMALRFANTALVLNDMMPLVRRATPDPMKVEAARCQNVSARLMAEFQGAALTLQKLRTGGNQTVTVQHVNVQPGGQAVVGTVQTGGPNYSGGQVK